MNLVELCNTAESKAPEIHTVDIFVFVHKYAPVHHAAHMFIYIVWWVMKIAASVKNHVNLEEESKNSKNVKRKVFALKNNGVAFIEVQ